MAGTKGNRRTIYTKKVIRESLLELLSDKEIHQITVTDICKKADINRGTFYAHYKDAFELLQTMEDDFFNQITKYVDENPVVNNPNNLLIKVFGLLKENKDLCTILFCKHKGSEILDRVLYIAYKVDIDKIFIDSQLDKSHLNYLIRYSVGGMLAVVQTWLENGLKESPCEIVDIINNINKVSYV